MTMGPTVPRSNKLIVRFLHRWLGVAAATFVLVFAATGWLLNHTDKLALGKRHVDSSAVLNWYGIDSPRVDAGYQLRDSDWLVQAAGQVFLNDRRIVVERRNLVGALALSEPDVIAVAVPGTLYLFTPRGKLIEAMDGVDDLPARLERLGVSPAGTLVVQAGTGVFEADRQVTRWSAFIGGSARWARRDAVPRDLARRIAAEARRHLLSWERVLLDLHSGRLFGPVGILVFDIVAGVLVALGGTGLYIWLTALGRPR